MSALLWPLFSRWTWAEPATDIAGTTGEDDALASVSFFDVAQPATVVAVTSVEGSALASVRLVCRGYNQPLWWRLRHVRALFWLLVSWLAWDLPLIVVVGSTGYGADVASVLLDGLGPASHCGGVHDR